MEPLRSSDNAAFRALLSLAKDASARREQCLALAEGPHLAAEALACGRLRQLWLSEATDGSQEISALEQRAQAASVPVRRMSEALAGRLSDAKTPQGVLAVVATASIDAPGGQRLWLALDALQDPGNVGTLLRSAWAVGAAVLLGPGCADPWSPKVLRAGAGAQFAVPWRQVPDLAAALKELAKTGIDVYGTLPKAAKAYLDLDLSRPHAWVLGSEGQGLSPDVTAACTGQVRISYPGKAESLNAAVSGAVLLFESLRCQLKPN